MTVEEKIISHIEQNCTYPDGSPMIDEQTFYEGAKWGYNEAMRWRDPKEELPNEGEEVQLKVFHTYHNKQEYTHDVYMGGRWMLCESKYIVILGWRPIE